MKLYDYYRESANLTLNGALAAVVPVVLLLMLNAFFMHMKDVMYYCFPFFFYSIFCFQIYLFKMKRSMKIFQNINVQTKMNASIFNSRQLLLFFTSTFKPKLFLFFSDGTMAGEIVRLKKNMNNLDRLPPAKRRREMYSLLDHEGTEIGKYIVCKNKGIDVEIYNDKNEYIGSFHKGKKTLFECANKEILDSTGRVFGKVEGASFFMKEIIKNVENEEIAKLSRGVLPIEWEGRIPDANTPVFTFNTPFSGDTKLLALSLLIDQYFIER
ncbi:MAG: hypothetical protein Q8906_08745 [Bacillota bacterium]|nr:hypothetical protein [Bacillota bacterium]MDP4170685.1 hypothetical protein [Bacillota bacterium]